MTRDPVQEQYEALPYPERNPADETRRLITGSPSQIDEVVHHVLGGLWPADRTPDNPFRALVAGGGTGDAAIMLAQQARDRGLAAEITYLDMSSASRRICAERARLRGLDKPMGSSPPIRFVNGSLLDVATLAPGPYDYIDCCGVLHHLEDPAAGLAALVSVLAPGGGMGLMVYAPYGRTGVYPLQAALRTLLGDQPQGDRVDLTRRLIKALPPGNWFTRNPLLSDHKTGSAGLYDLLLHARDRAYDIPALMDFLRGGGLRAVSMIPGIAYDPRVYVRDPLVLGAAQSQPRETCWALAEQLSGALTKHVVYAVRADDPRALPATIDDPEMIPVPVEFEPGQFAKALEANPGQRLTATIGGAPAKFPLPPLAPRILRLVDGKSTLAQIHAGLMAGDPPVGADEARRQMNAAFDLLIMLGKIMLRKAA